MDLNRLDNTCIVEPRLGPVLVWDTTARRINPRCDAKRPGPRSRVTVNIVRPVAVSVESNGM